MSTDHAALLLAAGGSLRLGRAKQLLRRDGETLLRRAARLALATTPRRCLVAVGAQAGRMREALAGLPLEIVEVSQWREGLGASLAALRRALDTDAPERVLVLGCDQPALDAAHLQALLVAARAAPSGMAFSGYEQVRGLPAVVATTQLRQARLVGDRGLRALARAPGRPDIAEVYAPALALDLDTPADVAEAISRGWLQADD